MKLLPRDRVMTSVKLLRRDDPRDEEVKLLRRDRVFTSFRMFLWSRLISSPKRESIPNLME